MAELIDDPHDTVLTSNVRQARIARVYAEALLALAAKEGKVEEAGDELQALATGVLAKNPLIATFFASPAITHRTRGPVLAKALAGQASPLMQKFIGVLNQNGRLDLLRHVAAAYSGLRDVKEGRVRVGVRSAVPLTEQQQQDLRASLAASLRKEPILDLKTDPELLGGMVIQVGDKVYDSSVRTRLQALRTQLTARGINVVKA